MSDFTEKLKEALLKASLPFDETTLTHFEVYKNVLLLWNKSINLTAIEDDEDIIYKHFIDSLMVLRIISEFSNLLDIGSGAGFPGVPLKIIRRETKLTLIESQKRRRCFLEFFLKDLL